MTRLGHVVDQRARSLADRRSHRTYASLVQQVLREKVETGAVVLVGRGGQVVLPPLFVVRKEVPYSSQ
jgi:hypothetical protein